MLKYKTAFLFILDTTLSPSSSYNNLRSRQIHHLKNDLKDGSAFSRHNSDTLDKGFVRFSKGLIILCVFIGCTSLFVLHTRRNPPYVNLSDHEGDTHSNKKAQKSKDQASGPFHGSNQPFHYDQEGMSFVSFKIATPKQEPWRQYLLISYLILRCFYV